MARPLTAGARVMVFDEEERVLLVRHSYMPGWFLPGGGVGRGETMRAAAAREVEEEAGIVPTGDLRFFGLYANFREHKSDHVALFVLRSFKQVPRSSFEIAEFGFFPLNALPPETSDATRMRIREVLEDKSPAEYWSVD